MVLEPDGTRIERIRHRRRRERYRVLLIGPVEPNLKEDLFGDIHVHQRLFKNLHVYHRYKNYRSV